MSRRRKALCRRRRQARFCVGRHLCEVSFLLVAVKWPAVSISDSRTYAVLQDHINTHHNNDKIRAAIDVYNKLITLTAAAGAATRRPDEWTHKRMMFTALAMVGEFLQNHSHAVQAITANAPMSICDNPFLHTMQKQINTAATCSNRRRAATTDLPHLFYCCQLSTATEVTATDWPASMLMDGCSRKNGVKFEAIFSFVFFYLIKILCCLHCR